MCRSDVPRVGERLTASNTLTVYSVTCVSYNFPLLAFDFSPETCAADTILSAVYRRCFMWKSTTNLATSSAYFGRKLHPRSRSRSLKVVFFETCSAVCSESNRSKALRLCKLTFALNDFPILQFDFPTAIRFHAKSWKFQVETTSWNDSQAIAGASNLNTKWIRQICRRKSLSNFWRADRLANWRLQFEVQQARNWSFGIEAFRYLIWLMCFDLPTLICKLFQQASRWLAKLF